MVLSTSVVQTYIANKVTQKINQHYGTSIHIDRLGLNWKGEIDIRDLYIEDHHQDTLIYSKKLVTNLLSVTHLANGKLDFGFIELYEPKFYLKTYQNERLDNISIFAKLFVTDTLRKKSSFRLNADHITLNKGNVKITNDNFSTGEIFNLSKVTIDTDNFSLIGPTVKLEVNQLSLLDKRGFEIKNMEGDFSYTPTSIQLNSLKLTSQESFISGDFSVYYKKGGLSDFLNKATLDFNFYETKIGTNDLNSFFNEFGKNQMITLNGDVDGTLNDFTFSNGLITSNNIRVKGIYNFKNLFKKNKEYIIDASNHSIITDYESLSQLMPRIIRRVLPEEVEYLGNIDFIGNTTITKSSLISASNLVSSLGTAQTKIKIDALNNSEKASYFGEINFNNFDLGKFGKTERLGTITATLEIEGVGFTKKSLNTRVKGVINSFIFEDYNYQNITLSGNFKNPLFDGILIIDDPNLKFDFSGLVDISEELNRFDFNATVDYAELNQLNIFKRDSVSIFAGKVDMEMNGNDLNTVFGTIAFKETFYQNEKDNFYFDNFKITSTQEDLKRTININSPDIMIGSIKGEFLIEEIPTLFLNGVGSIYTNYKPQSISKDQFLDFDFEIYNKLVEIFIPDLQFGENTRIKGTVYSNESKLKFDFASPEIMLFDNYLGNVKFNVNNHNPLYNTYISADTINNGLYNLKDFNFINKTINDTLYVHSNFKGGKNKDQFNLSLYHTINKDNNSVVGVKKSAINFNGNTWFLNEKNDKKNKIIFDEEFNAIKFDSIVLNNKNEFIKFAGSTNDSTYKNLKVSFKNVDVGKLVPKVDSLTLKGIINGNLNIVQKNGLYYPTSNITVDAIDFNKTPLGDMIIAIEGNSELTRYDLITTLTHNNSKSLNATGYIDTKTENALVQLNLELNEFNLNTISPFGGNVIKDIRGNLSGNGKLSGNLYSPDIDGSFKIVNGGLNVPYLNIDYTLDKITHLIVTEEKLEIENTTMTDSKYFTNGTLSGLATHTNFRNWKLDLKIDSNNLLVLDTPKKDNQLYYGTAFISGNTHIYGPINELNIDVLATTQENTEFKIPLSETESIGDDSFIKFLSPKEKEAKLRGESIITDDLKGLSLNFELDINKNAEIEIVIDQETKSALRGRGAGTLLIEINTLGKFNMWGDFIVYEGIYDFRYGKIIRKEIEVEKGGTITWDGLASNANLNLKAIYKSKANPSALLDDPTINRKIPVDVYIDLTEKITRPELLFDIDFPEVSSTVRSELEYKLQTQEEREKQALFLLTTGSFISETAGQSAITGTVTDGVNAILAEILTDDDAVINIAPYYDMGIDTKEIETQDEFGVQFSSQISERIVVNGKVGIPVGKINESRVAGDVDVQWLVNEDGSLRINFFNRQAELQFIGEDQTFEQGAGVSYQVDFDTIKNLMDRIFGVQVELVPDEEINQSN